MQILIYGFQRSGTTLLRRLIQLHPDVKKVFHEQLVLRRLSPNPKMLKIYLRSFNINIKNDNWGEKVPYYKTAKKESPVKYCKTWLETFKRQGKIVNIIRHPYDTAFSIVKKYGGIKNINKPLRIYNNVVPKVLKALEGNDCVLNIKYEDLLINTDKIIYQIYEFCGLDPDIDYKKRMKQITNLKYQTINPKRAFAYKNKKFKKKVDITKIINLLNKVDGVRYQK